MILFTLIVKHISLESRKLILTKNQCIVYCSMNLDSSVTVNRGGYLQQTCGFSVCFCCGYMCTWGTYFLFGQNMFFDPWYGTLFSHHFFGTFGLFSASSPKKLHICSQNLMYIKYAETFNKYLAVSMYVLSENIRWKITLLETSRVAILWKVSIINTPSKYQV